MFLLLHLPSHYLLVLSVTELPITFAGTSTPFVVLREKPSDSPNNASKLLLQSFTTIDFTTTNGSLVGQAIQDYVDQYISLRDEGLMKWAVQNSRLYTKGITIAGHGVGAAIANLLATELLIDYSNEFPVRLRTFGAPRVFTMTTANRLELETLSHLFHYPLILSTCSNTCCPQRSVKNLPSYSEMSFRRYINDGDCYPSLPIRLHGLGHIGSAIKYSEKNGRVCDFHILLYQHSREIVK